MATIIPSNPTTTVTWTGVTDSILSNWLNNTVIQVFDRLIDNQGNYIIDNQGNYISLGGGIVTSSSTNPSSWQQTSGQSTVWQAVA